jgi:tropinone reductase I
LPISIAAIAAVAVTVIIMTTKESILQAWSLKGRNYVVTGGAKGIGLSVVRALLAHDAASVVFCSRGSCDDLVKDLQAEYSQAKIVHVSCDVSTSEGRQTLVSATRKEVSSLHGLVNNVGTNIRKSIEQQTEQEFQQTFATNVDSAYFCCQMFSDFFATNGATVVNVSSAAGIQSSGTGIAYGMTKAAMNQLTRGLACEWAKRGIRVNAVAPWMTITPMLEAAIEKNPTQVDKVKAWTPMHRLGQPDDVANAVVFFCLPASGFVTGQILAIDGGLTAQGFDGPCVTAEEATS